MNVQIPQSLLPMRSLHAPTPEGSPPTPAGPSNPQPPQDSFIQSGGREAMRNAVRWGNATSTVLGGAGALTLATGSLYAGVLGGAVVGSALGMGAGPVVASLGSNGALDFLGTTFGTAGVAAKAGIILGGAAMAAGAWGIGSSLGSAVGKPAGALLGAPVGFAQGIWGHMEGATPSAPEKPAPKEAPKALDLNNMTGATKVMAMGLGGAGLLAGGAGGAILGASVTSAHSLVQGLLAHNVTLASITGAAGIGAAVGAAAGAVIGGKGGFELAKGAQKAGQWLSEKLIRQEEKPSVPKPDGSPSTAQQASNGVINFSRKISAVQLGMNLSDVGMSAAYPLSSNPMVGNLGFGLVAIHAVRGIGHLFAAADTSGITLQHRLSIAAGEALLAGGHIVGANGGGIWSLPLLAAGTLLNTVSDYRYRAQYGV